MKAYSLWGMEGTGEAGRIFKLDHYDLPDFPVSDGNSGVNLAENVTKASLANVHYENYI